jgi:hypothetical protein
VTRIVDSNGVPREVKDVDQSGGKYSPKASIYVADGGKLIPMVILMAVVCGVTVATTISLYMKVQHAEQTDDLKRYDLDFFKQNDWATLKAQVETQRALIEAYGLQNAVKAAVKEK